MGYQNWQEEVDWVSKEHAAREVVPQGRLWLTNTRSDPLSSPHTPHVRRWQGISRRGAVAQSVELRVGYQKWQEEVDWVSGEHAVREVVPQGRRWLTNTRSNPLSSPQTPHVRRWQGISRRGAAVKPPHCQRALSSLMGPDIKGIRCNFVPGESDT